MHLPPPLTLTLTSWPSFRGDDANSGCSIHALGSGGDDGGEAGAVRLGGLIWGTAVASGASVFVGSTNRRFCRVDVGQKNELTVAWTYTVPPERADTLIDSAASLSPDGRQVVVPGGDGRLHALDAATGALQWRFSAHSDGDSDASAALGGGGGVSDERHDSGVVVNSFEGNVRHSADGARVYAGCDNAAFYCVDAATGRQLWRFDTGMMIWTVAALMDGLVLFGSLDGTLYALDALDGRLVAKHVTGGEIKSSPLALDGSVFVCNSNGRVQRLALSVSARREHGGAAAATFEPVWAYEAGAEVYGSPALCAATGTLVVTDMLGGVAALDARDGSLRWRRETFGYVAGSPVVTADGVVVVGTSAGWLLALSVRDGVPVGALVLANGRVAPLVLSPDASRRSRPDRSKGIRTALNASPIVLPGGTVVVGSYDGHAYVVPGRRLLASLPADMEPHHLQHMLHPREHEGGEMTTHMDRMSADASAIVCLCLHAYDDEGEYVPRASITRVRVTVREAGGDAGTGTATDAATDITDAFDVKVSPDGRCVNLVPRSPERAGEDAGGLRVTVVGEYHVQAHTWLGDRFVRSTQRGVPFACPEVAVPAHSTETPSGHPGTGGRGPRGGSPPPSYFEGLPAGAGWDLHGCAVPQPFVLETYVPAAMDAQGFVARIFGHRRDGTPGGKGKGTFFILCTPALPDPEGERGHAGPVVVREPAKVVVMQATYSGDTFLGTSMGPFRFAAMGGTIPMSEFRVLGRIVDRVTGELRIDFYACASCLSIEGNGKSYSFSPELVNDMCSEMLEVHAIGSFAGRRSADVSISQDRRQKHLLVWADTETGLVDASLAPLDFGAAVAPSCRAVLFVDGNLFRSGGGGGDGMCNVPTRGVFSSDGLMLDNVLGPLVKLACDTGVQPNAITLSSLVTTAAVLYFHRIGGAARLAVPLLVMYKWASDVLDGAVARQCDRKSALGGVLDAVADIVFYVVAGAVVASVVFPRTLALDRPLPWFLSAVGWVASWAALVALNGSWSVLSDHKGFKNNGNPFNQLMWSLSENTLIVALGISAAYVAFAVPRGSAKAVVKALTARSSSASIAPLAIVGGAFAVVLLTVLLRPTRIAPDPVTGEPVAAPRPLAGRLAACALLLLVAAVVLHAVWCMSSSSTASDCPACVGAAYVAAGVVAVFVGVWAVSEFAR